MATNYIVNVPKLKGRENYGDWVFAVENFLVLEGMSKCITEVIEADDAKAKAKITLTIDSSLYVHIREAKTAVDLWKKLKSLFDDSGYTRKISLLRTLISTRLENCESMQSYVNQIVESGQKLRGTGFNIDDEWIGSILLAGLPERFGPMIMAIEHSGIAVSTDSIKQKLLDMEEEDVGKPGNAFAAKGWQKYNKRNVGNPGTEGSVKKDVKTIKCFKCKQMGHYQNKCPNNNTGKSTEKTTENQQTQRGSNAFSAVFMSGEFNKSDWYVDSGASIHLTTNKDWIRNERASKISEIMVANNTLVEVKTCGDIEIETEVNENCYPVTIKDVLYVPELTTNLLSVSQLVKNGNSVKFETGRCEIYNEAKELVATANLTGGVYKLNTNKDGPLFVGAAVAGEIWHRRFGHLNSKYLNKMNKECLVNGLRFNNAVKTDKSSCEVCCEAKQSKQPFSHIGTRAKAPLELVHADVNGPMENLSLGGSRYFLLFEDDYTRMGFVYFLKTKDEVFDCLEKFKVLVENQTGLKIKKIRTDNGKEFCNKKVDNFVSTHGIVHQTTNAYTPEQNGMCERLNRTVVEKAKCLLFDAKLDKVFWAEATHTAIYLRNRSLASGLTKTPFEMWYGEKPDVGNLRIFGSAVMTHIPKEKRLKWDKKAAKQILVGYSETVKGYRVYDPIKGIITTSRDVIVMEPQKQDETDITLTMNTSELQGDIVSVGDTSDYQDIDDSRDNVTENSSDLDEYIPEREVEVPESGTARRSERIPKPRSFEDYVTYLSCETPDLDDPVTLQEALSRPDAERWNQAVETELQSFEENQAWELVNAPEGASVVECKWVFRKKIDSDNNVRYRARLVAKGFTQKYGVDFDETFSPVVRHSTLRLLLALSIKLELDIDHLDVTTAFLNGQLDERVFMKQPDGFVKM